MIHVARQPRVRYAIGGSKKIGGGPNADAAKRSGPFMPIPAMGQEDSLVNPVNDSPGRVVSPNNELFKRGGRHALHVFHIPFQEPAFHPDIDTFKFGEWGDVGICGEESVLEYPCEDLNRRAQPRQC